MTHPFPQDVDLSMNPKRRNSPAGGVLDPAAIQPRLGSGYPAPFAKSFESRAKRALGDPCGLTKFGVNLTTLEPGVASSLRHWHTAQDEFVYVLEGELVLVSDAGEEILRPGMAAGFPAGKADGHHLVNRSQRPARYLEIGDRADGDEVTYPDVDLLGREIDGKFRFLHKDGKPY